MALAKKIAKTFRSPVEVISHEVQVIWASQLKQRAEVNP